MNFVQSLLLRLFLSSADDLIAFLDGIEQRLRALADKGYAEAARLRLQADTVAENAAKAARVADRVKG